MRKRWALLVAGCAGCLVLVGSVFQMSLLTSGQSFRKRVAKVQDEMTLAEVQEALGGPGEDGNTLGITDPAYVTTRTWRFGRQQVVVGFDANGKFAGIVIASTPANLWEDFLNRLDFSFWLY